MSFLGHVDEDLAVTVSHALAEPLTTTEFRVSIFGAGAFPCKGLPRIIWLGVGNGSAQLVALRNEIGGRLKPLGFDVGAHEYSAHLTLGRVKVRSGRAERIIRQLLVSASVAIEPWSVDHITLYESEAITREVDLPTFGMYKTDEDIKSRTLNLAVLWPNKLH